MLQVELGHESSYHSCGSANNLISLVMAGGRGFEAHLQRVIVVVAQSVEHGEWEVVGSSPTGSDAGDGAPSAVWVIAQRTERPLAGFQKPSSAA